MEEDELEEEDEDLEEEEEEQKGFKPLQEGKSFVPIKDQVTFKPYSDAKPSTSDKAPSATGMSPLQPSYPRPIHPLLLEAMYRMQRPSFAPPTSFGAARPQYPFSPPIMPFGSTRYTPDFLHHLHHPGK